MITNSDTANFAEINPLHQIAVRNVRHHALADKSSLFTAEFSLTSAAASLNTLQDLNGLSAPDRDRALYGKILKSAAALHVLGITKGPYKLAH